MGRKPKPDHLKAIDGNPGKRPFEPPAEAEPPAEDAQNPAPMPTPELGAEAPAWLDDRAKEAWNSMAPELERLGVLTKIDVVAFANCCELFANWRRCADAVEKDGATYERNGMIRRHPLYDDMLKFQRELRKAFAEFGLTPIGRSRLANSMAAGGQMWLPGLGQGEGEKPKNTGTDAARGYFGW